MFQYEHRHYLPGTYQPGSLVVRLATALRTPMGPESDFSKIEYKYQNL